MSHSPVRARRRVLVRGDLVHDLTELTVGLPGVHLVLPQCLPTLVLRSGSAERVDLLTGARARMGSVLCGPSTRPWAVREEPGSRVTVLRLRPEALVRLGAPVPQLVDGCVDLDVWGLRLGGAAGVDAGDRDTAALDRALSEVATPVDDVLRQRVGAAVGLVLAHGGVVSTVEMARAAQLPPSELFLLLDDALGLDPERVAAAERLRRAVRRTVPSGASLQRVLAGLGELTALAPRELERLGLDHAGLDLVLRRGAGLVTDRR
ncbi:hypothetical protein [Cellulomonas sp. NPDC089187]|uniref:hypothetical protein n=1 Tax=Cellulomonas sp. NPDC089187 TaxID=3154970 RepID=UPI003423DAF6